MCKLFEFGIGFAADGAVTIGGMQHATGIAEKRTHSGASVLLGGGGNFKFRRSTQRACTADDVANGISVFHSGGQVGIYQPGLLRGGAAMQRRPEFRQGFR